MSKNSKYYRKKLAESKTANITKDDVTLQHIAKMSLWFKVLSYFVIFAVLVLRVGGCCP